MKRAIIVHGWEGSPEGGWIPWLKKELEARRFKVQAPALPDTDNPEFGPWLEHLKETVGDPDGDCYLVGHSLGCITILRYLEALGEGQEIGGAVLVAGFSDNLGYKEIDSFFAKLIDWDNIKARCRKFVAIHSDNDEYVPLKHGDIFRERLGAEVIVKNNMGHFSGDEDCTELPVALESVLKISK